MCPAFNWYFFPHNTTAQGEGVELTATFIVVFSTSSPVKLVQNMAEKGKIEGNLEMVLIASFWV
jgi:hypothetical protein